MTPASSAAAKPNGRAKHEDEFLALKQLKEGGKRLVGLMPMYVPEEIVHAAGMLPVALPGRSGPVLLASAHLHSNLCHPIQGNFEAALAGDLDSLEGIVFADICDQTKRVGNLWEIYYQTAYSFHLRLPKRLDAQSAFSFYAAELHRFHASLEKLIGHRITDDQLRASIATYNRFRQHVRALYEVRRAKPEAFGPSEIAYFLTKSMSMPKEEAIAKLPELVPPRDSLSLLSPRKPRFVVCGNPCEAASTALLDLVGEVGAAVADDCLYSGSMYMSAEVQEHGNPIEALARSYFVSRPCPTKHGKGGGWPAYIIEMVKASGADAVVVILHKYCEVFAFDCQELEQRLADAGIPHVVMEIENGGANARFKTMLQALVEMLKVAG